MFMARRLLAFLMVATISLGMSSSIASADDRTPWGAITGPVTASSMGIKVPTTMSQVKSLRPADIDRINAAAYARLPEVIRLIEAGKLSAGGSTSAARARSTSLGGRLPAPRLSHLFSDAQCGVWWWWTGSGWWHRGGGWTRSNTTAYLELTGGRLYRNSSWVGSFGAILTGTNAESYTSWIWRNWWEPSDGWFVESTHGIKPDASSAYDYGPAYCSYGVNH